MVVKIEPRRKWRRGHRTYHGSHKKWRGGGSRGGRGKAGMHKHKWTYTVKYAKDHFGKRGFKSVKQKRLKKKEGSLNLIDLSKLIEKFKDKLEKVDGFLKIKLKDFGYTKLLGRGKITHPIIVEVENVTAKAKEKIEKVGGKVVTPDAKNSG